MALKHPIESRRRVFVAFCEAMTPTGGPLPPSDAEMWDPVLDFVSDLEPRLMHRIGLVLEALEWSPLLFGRFSRFSRLGPGARASHIERLAKSRFWVAREMLVLVKTLSMLGYGRSPAVQHALGYTAGCRAAGPDEDRLGKTFAALRAEDLVPPGEDLTCDVVVVGSGAGGAVVADVLAGAGLDVIVLEAGGYFDRGSYSSDPIESLRTLYRDSGLTVCEGLPTIPLPVGRAVGGTTVVNSGTCFRAPAAVLEAWRREFGLDFSQDEMDRTFSRIERELLVKRPDADHIGGNGRICLKGARALGASGAAISRYAGSCDRCGTCPQGCAIDAKQAMHVSYLPRARASGARIFAHSEVDRIDVSDGVVRGVHVRAAPDAGAPARAFSVRARAAVLAGGALGTPELLLRSGLGRDRPRLGRNLHIHPACWVGASYPEPVRGWEGIMQSAYVDEWSDRGLLLEATFTPLPFGAHWLPGTGRRHKERLERYDRLGSIGVHLSDRSAGRVRLDHRGRARISYRLSRREVELIHFGIARAAEIHFAAGATEVYPQVSGVDTVGPGDLGAFEQATLKARDLRLEAFHPMGTCSMGSDDKTAPLLPTGELRGLRNLYVADASVFPTSLGVNPMMTIMAFADAIARRLERQLQASRT